MSKTPKPYSENNPDHVPNPLYQNGVVDTTGTTGDLGGRIDTVSPVFAQARAAALGQAVEALDDPDRDESEVVVFPDSDKTREDAEKELREAAKDAEKSDQLKTGKSEAELEAAKTGDSGSSAADKASTTGGSSAPRKQAAKKAPAKKA